MGLVAERSCPPCSPFDRTPASGGRHDRLDFEWGLSFNDTLCPSGSLLYLPER